MGTREIMRQQGDEERLKAEKAKPNKWYVFVPGPPYDWEELEGFLEDLADYESGEMAKRPKIERMEGESDKRYLIRVAEILDGRAEFDFFDGMMKSADEFVCEESPKICAFCGNPTAVIWWFNHQVCWAGLCGRAGYVHVCAGCKAWYPSSLCVIS